MIPIPEQLDKRVREVFLACLENPELANPHRQDIVHYLSTGEVAEVTPGGEFYQGDPFSDDSLNDSVDRLLNSLYIRQQGEAPFDDMESYFHAIAQFFKNSSNP